jgi:hypothetical protein
MSVGEGTKRMLHCGSLWCKGEGPHPASITRPEGRASFWTPYGATFSREREQGVKARAGCAERNTAARRARSAALSLSSHS